MQVCPKCRYERKPTDTAPEWECPSCGIAYAKFEEISQGQTDVRAPISQWHCYKCGAANPPSTEKCSACGFPAPHVSQSLFHQALLGSSSEDTVKIFQKQRRQAMVVGIPLIMLAGLILYGTSFKTTLRPFLMVGGVIFFAIGILNIASNMRCPACNKLPMGNAGGGHWGVIMNPEVCPNCGARLSFEQQESHAVFNFIMVSLIAIVMAAIWYFKHALP